LLKLNVFKGNFLIAICESKGITATRGKVYAESYLIIKSKDRHSNIDIQKNCSINKTEEVTPSENLSFATVMSVSIH